MVAIKQQRIEHEIFIPKLEYELVETTRVLDDGREAAVYGIKIVSYTRTGGEIGCVYDVCPDKALTERLLHRVILGQVTPTTLGDVVEDYLGEVYGGR